MLAKGADYTLNITLKALVNQQPESCIASAFVAAHVLTPTAQFMLLT